MTYGDWAQWRRRVKKATREPGQRGPTPGMGVYDRRGRMVEPEAREWADSHGFVKASVATSNLDIAQAVAERR